MSTKDEVARRKLSVLELISGLNNLSKACRIIGYSRQQFYKIRRDYQTYDAEGLMGRLPDAKDSIAGIRLFAAPVFGCSSVFAAGGRPTLFLHRLPDLRISVAVPLLPQRPIAHRRPLGLLHKVGHAPSRS